MSLLVLSFFKNREVGACKAAALRRPGIALKEDARLISKVHHTTVNHTGCLKACEEGGVGNRKRGTPSHQKRTPQKIFQKK